MKECCLTKLNNFKEKVKSCIPPNLSVPDIIQYFHVFLAGLAAVIGFFVVLIRTCSGYRDWQVALGVLGACAVILGVVMTVKKFLKNLYTSNRTITVAQSKNSLLLGFFGIMAFGFLPRIIVNCDPYNSELNFFIVSISLPAIALIYMLVIRKAKKNYQIVYHSSDVLPWLILALNYVLFCVSIKLSYVQYHRYDRWNNGYYYNGGWYYSGSGDGSFWIQILMTPICAVSMIEFGQVLRDKVVSVHKTEQENEPKKDQKKPLTCFENPLFGLQIEGNDQKSTILAESVHQSSVMLTEELEPQV